jgi:hypothetical protein
VVASRVVGVGKYRRCTDGGRRRLCLGEDVRHLSLGCLGTGNWRMNFVNGIW